MINKNIIDTLKPIGLPIYYITRGDNNPTEWIIFNYIEAPNAYADMKEEKTEYTILINIYCSRENLVNYREQARTLLQENGFTKVTIANAFLTTDESVKNRYCIPLNYKYFNFN